MSTGSYLVNASANSAQVGQLKVGDQATITVSGSTATVYGTVGSIGLLASTSSGVSSFPVVINVTGSPAGLYGGSSATVSIITEELQDVIVVPTTAIHYSGSAITVTLDNGGTKVTQPVTIGAASGGNTQITSGLKAGQKVYVTEVSFHGGLGTRGGSGLFGGGGAGFTGGGGSGAGKASAGAGASADTPDDTGSSPGSGPLDDTAQVQVEPTGRHPRIRPAVIEVEDVRKTYANGTLEVEALRGVSFDIQTRRVRGHHGPVRLGQVHPDAHPRLPRRPHLGDVPSGRRGREHDVRGRAGPRPQPADRIRLPAVQPAGLAHRLAERRAAAGLRRRGPGRRASSGPWPRSTGSGSGTGSTTAPASCPGASSSGWPWPGPWSPIPPSSWPTSRPATSTRSRPTRSSRLLDELHRSGRTIVLITHDADVAASAERIMRIRDGEVFDADPAGIAAGPPMSLLETFRTGLEAVVTHRLRSTLTVLGIMIGITAVILTVGLGEGAQQQVGSEITALGSNLLTISPGSTTSASGIRGGFGSASTLTMFDATALASKTVAPDINAVAPTTTESETLAAGTANWTTTVVGTDPSWLTVRGRSITEGRFIAAHDVATRAAVAVLGSDHRRGAVRRP